MCVSSEEGAMLEDLRLVTCDDGISRTLPRRWVLTCEEAF
jgi:hypothetical protein